MKNISIFLLGFLLLFSCKQSTELTHKKSIPLDGIAPIGLTMLKGRLWIADGDNNRLVKLKDDGTPDQIFEDFDRPMHIDNDGESIFIPEYGLDQIIQFKNSVRTTLALKDSLEAPAAISIVGEEIAIADFYNHRIVYFDGSKWMSFGKEGKGKGEFYYPTDVQIFGDNIYVADAYNNRVQVMDKKGNSLQLIGVEQKMNATTGIYVNKDHLFATDFEHNRILVFNLDGTLRQVIKENLSNPTDVLWTPQGLYATNYKGQSLTLYNY